MIIISIPNTFISERTWILSTIFGDFFGLEHKIIISDAPDVVIQHNGKLLIVSDVFFKTCEGKWLEECTLPVQPLKIWNLHDMTTVDVKLTSRSLPVIFGKGGVDISKLIIKLDLDIFGSAFYMMSRYEEVVINDKDKFNRFPATSSLAFQEDFLDRPIINEYIEILWSLMHFLWPSFSRKKNEYCQYISSDVDTPYNCGTLSLKRLIRQIASDIVKKKDYLHAIRTIKCYYSRVINKVECDYRKDEYYQNLKWMMSVNEKNDNKMAFYFIVDHSSHSMDGCYNINEKPILDLIGDIADRGHEIGLHPSFNTYDSLKQTKKEVLILKKVARLKGVSINNLGSRQHYLRWSTPDTALNLANSGVKYDTTLGYADLIGYRCGVCYEYGFYDVIKKTPINLMIRPLLIMDVALFGRKNMNFSYDGKSLEIINKYKKQCQQFGGNFTLLWHCNQFPNIESKHVYSEAISKV
jgi:peptidoglycan/xylan/chitin deacetylase (PgdA/CDA1 family)